MTKIKVLGLCGSLRVDSWNLKLLRNFLGAMNPEQYSTQLYGPLDLPLMNQDLESGPLPEKILALRKAVEDSQVVVFASPEYNASISPVLKNAIDWASRPPANLWSDKIGVLLAASPGMLGGARGLIHLRAVLSTNKTWVIPEQVQCPQANNAFGADGNLTQPQVQKQIAGALESLGVFSRKFLAPSTD